MFLIRDNRCPVFSKHKKMSRLSSNPEIHVLQSFSPLSVLNDRQLERLAEVVEIEQAPAGRTLIKKGSRDNYGLYLIEGRLRLKTENGEIRDVRSGDPLASNPIAQELPRYYDVISVTPVRFLRITIAVFNDIAENRMPERRATENGGEHDEQLRRCRVLKEKITSRFRMDLEKDRVQLPSLPEVAVQVGRALRNEISDASVVAEIIQADPAITAKLIKAANSAMYGRCSPVETCTGAIVRLGTNITHKLVLSFAMRELFHSKSHLLQPRMRELWKHSTHVAAICYVLARHDRRFNAEQAMLVGLLHDIGAIAIIQYLERHMEEGLDSETVDSVITGLRAQAGSMLLRSWGFPIEFIVAAMECEEWMRDREPSPDYCDLVLVAQLHSYTGTRKAESLPGIGHTPAYGHLNLGELTVDKGLKIVDKDRDTVAETQSLLNI